MTLDCQPVAAAERRPAERAIHTIIPATARAASRIHSHRRLVPDPRLATGEPLGLAVAVGGAALWVGGWAVTVVVLGLGVLVTGPGEVLVAGPGVLVTGGAEVLAAWLGTVLALRLDEMLAVRVGEKLAIALCALLPQPAARHPIRMAVKRKRP